MNGLAHQTLCTGRSMSSFDQWITLGVIAFAIRFILRRVPSLERLRSFLVARFNARAVGIISQNQADRT